MPYSALESFDKEQLLEYVQSLLWQYRVVDAFWFLKAEEEFGRPMAEELNMRVWSKAGQLGVRDIIKRFGPFEVGEGETPIDVFLRVYQYYPWHVLAPFTEERTGPDELMLTMSDCPPQVARLSRNLGEYHCKGMHLAEFTGLLPAIHPQLRVECVYAPLDPHPEDHFCRWRIYVDRDAS